jgi:Sec7-like guanine-nucleotide exchange factor
MKFYKNNNSDFLFDYKIKYYKLTCVGSNYIRFYKNGIWHNPKNASYICNAGNKMFYLNDELYGYKDDFNKKSWRKFTKLKVFYEIL